MSARAPAWELLIGGLPLPAKYRPLIRSISLDASVDGADVLEIDAWGWDAQARDYAILGETILGAGNSVVARLGYTDGEIVTLQRFRLMGDTTNYPAGGRPSLKVRGLSALHRLVEHTEPRKFAPDQTYEDMATTLARYHGLDTSGISSGETATETGKATVKEKGESDLRFLQRMAWLAGHGPPIAQYDETFDADVLYFRPVSLDRQAYHFAFVYDVHRAGSDLAAGNLRSFEPVLNLAGQPTQIQVTGWDEIAQQAVRVTLEIVDGGQETTIQTGEEVGKVDAEIRSGGELQAVVLRDGQDIAEARKREALTTLHLRTTESALSYAQRWYRTRMQAFLQARARVDGTPGLWVGQVHQFRGLAPHHEGLWEVVGCRHVMGGQGYECDLDLVRVIDEAAGRTKEV